MFAGVPFVAAFSLFGSCLLCSVVCSSFVVQMSLLSGCLLVSLIVKEDLLCMVGGTKRSSIG